MTEYEEALRKLVQAEAACRAEMLQELYDEGMPLMPVTDELGEFMSKEKQVEYLRRTKD